jgi:RNA polymerase sigma factor (sigma-70 family)
VGACQSGIFLSQNHCAYRYIGVDVMSMSDRWAEADFEAIFREHYGRILRVSRRVLQRDSEAEEICADVFLRLYRSGPGVAADGLVGGWLYRTATRASIDALRANRRRAAEELEEDEGIQGELAEGPLTLLLRQERVGEVRDVLAKLKVEKAQLLLLRHSGLSYQEIAQAMRVDVRSVGTKLARAEAEFSALYRRHQRRQRKTQQLQTAKEGQ